MTVDELVEMAKVELDMARSGEGCENIYAQIVRASAASTFATLAVVAALTEIRDRR